jgi:YVTN family beta-propeller protein
VTTGRPALKFTEPVSKPGWVENAWLVRLLTAGLVIALVAAAALLVVPRPGESAVVLRAPVPSDPTSIFVGARDVWVASQAAGVVSVLDRASGHVTRTIRTGGAPARLAGTAGGVWVADAQRAAITPVTARPPRRYRSFAGGADVSDVAMASGAVWWTSSAEGVVRVRDRGSAQAHMLHVGARPIAVAADDRWVVVANSGDGTIARIDARRRRLAGASLRVGGTPVDVAVQGDIAWVLDAAGRNVSRIDLRTGSRGPLVDVGAQPVAVAADGDDVYVVSAGERALLRIDATGVKSRTPLGEAPSALALDPAHVWVTDMGDDTVTRYDR